MTHFCSLVCFVFVFPVALTQYVIVMEKLFSTIKKGFLRSCMTCKPFVTCFVQQKIFSLFDAFSLKNVRENEQVPPRFELGWLDPKSRVRIS